MEHNVIFTLVVIAGRLWAQRVDAITNGNVAINWIAIGPAN